ncbi:Uncharacterized conserved protein YndB, AHSA1/START domain [Lutibacter oricola]|uniref:Uncharacterized conserved protein YndB, AHSA1/START domain n=1 Tax=Lutibacter oricola TaxID=762486 RepID=A0A1H2QTJ0_9FLAO|nr:SRPBCC family protein [Lutibacter oricola]SDW10486.1 Uncharacterized conserved protein YndB, AHSA1/START domain [Lutibacter oricola]
MKLNDSIIVEQNFNSSLTKVRNAITKIDLMRQWFFNNIPDFKAEKGFKTQFNVSSGERNFLHLWEIVDVEKHKKIVYNWKYQEYTGNSFVFFELIEKKHKVKLIVTCKITEDFPSNIPEFTSESCKNGWNYFIKDRLKEFIEKK